MTIVTWEVIRVKTHIAPVGYRAIVYIDGREVKDTPWQSYPSLTFDGVDGRQVRPRAINYARRAAQHHARLYA